MANVNSLTSASSATSSLYGSRNVLTGLASGLDTESMIENSISGYKTKITQLEKSQTKIQWKQDSFREIISAASNLTSKYTSFTSSTNLMSATFFDSLASSSATGQYADAVSVSGATKSDVQVNEIKKLATSAQYVYSTNTGIWNNASNNTLNLNLSGDVQINKNAGIVTLSYGAADENGVRKSVQFEIGDMDKASNAGELTALIQNKLNGVTVQNAKGQNVSALSYFSLEESGGGLAVKANDYVKGTDADGNETWTEQKQSVGITLQPSAATGREGTETLSAFQVGTQSANGALGAYLDGKSVTVTLDGQERKITLGRINSVDELTAYLDKEINKAYYRDQRDEPTAPTEPAVARPTAAPTAPEGTRPTRPTAPSGSRPTEAQRPTEPSFAKPTAADLPERPTGDRPTMPTAPGTARPASVPQEPTTGERPTSAPSAPSGSRPTAPAVPTGQRPTMPTAPGVDRPTPPTRQEGESDEAYNARYQEYLEDSNKALWDQYDTDLADYNTQNEPWIAYDQAFSEYTEANAPWVQYDADVVNYNAWNQYDAELANYNAWNQYDADMSSYNTAIQPWNNYDSQMADYQSRVTAWNTYETNLANYNARVAAWDAYDAQMTDYNTAVAPWTAYDSQVRQYNSDMAAWRRYDTDYAAYQADKARYDSELAEYLRDKPINVTASADGTLTFDFNQPGNHTLKITSNINDALGMTSGLDSRINPTATKLRDVLSGAALQPLKINGTTISNSLSGESTIQDVMDAINNNSKTTGVTVSYSTANSQFLFKTTGTGAAQEIKLEGLAQQLFGNPETSGANYTKGEDAEVNVTVNGQSKTMYSSSNTLELDGLKIKMKDTTPAGQNAKIGFGGTSNNDEVVDAVKSFVEDYNKLLTSLRTAFVTQPEKQTDGSAYEPLTENERNSMSESALKSYEESAKKGLLFADSDLSSMYSKLVSSLTNNGVSRSEMAEIGITTSFKDGLTTLSLDEKKLRSAMEDGMDKVKRVFNNSSSTASDGLLGRMKTTLDTYTSTSISRPGILVRKAGTTLSAYSLNHNTLQNQVDSVQKQIESWQVKISNRIDYYTKQFSKLEQLMNTMNSQSSMLAGMMGG